MKYKMTFKGIATYHNEYWYKWKGDKDEANYWGGYEETDDGFKEKRIDYLDDDWNCNNPYKVYDDQCFEYVFADAIGDDGSQVNIVFGYFMKDDIRELQYNNRELKIGDMIEIECDEINKIEDITVYYNKDCNYDKRDAYYEFKLNDRIMKARQYIVVNGYIKKSIKLIKKREEINYENVDRMFYLLVRSYNMLNIPNAIDKAKETLNKYGYTK